ncbi:MAG TPA: single-stranded DNA-binding protein [Solirubrobacteraceae bacterium]|jgi:single-strand DNA-binding protein|nr:single-stranded DNA-binding protein [Solirubrobacteraceae bacterium]
MSYANINRVVLVGRLTADPELRALPSGTSVCSLRLACNGRRKGEDGEYEEKPNFFAVKVYGSTADAVHRYMARGRRVAVDGRLEWREWETAEGAKRQVVEVVADSVQFLDGGGADDRSVGLGEGERGAGDSLEGELVGVGAGIEDDIDF